MKKLCSVLLAFVLVFGLSTAALAADGGAFTVEVQETGVNVITVTICADAAGLKNSRMVFTYPEDLTLVSANPLLPGEAGISDLDISQKGTVSYAWAAYEAQKETPLLELTFRGVGGVIYAATLETPENGGSQSVSLKVPYRFRDVEDPQKWYYSTVYSVYDQGLMQGVGDDLFAPNNTLNRATVVTVLYRLVGCPQVSGSNPFTDVPEGAWYTDAVNWASEAGVVKGYGNGIFAPGRAVSRQELAAMFYRFWQYQGGDGQTSAGVLQDFLDGDSVPAWAVDAMAWAVEHQVIRGMTGGILEPRGGATRAQVAQILLNYQNVK